MYQPFYPLTIFNEAHRFEFVSIWERAIQKAIIFQKTDIAGVYQLVMGDVNEKGKLDIYQISDNGDMKKVMATIVQSIFKFLETRVDATVVFSGSTPTRTRLYQIAIAREFKTASQCFFIQGFDGFQFEPFERNKSYEGFGISLRKI